MDFYKGRTQFLFLMKDNKNGERTCAILQLTIMMIMMILMTMDENGTHGYIYTVRIKVELTWSMAMLQVGQKAR